MTAKTVSVSDVMTILKEIANNQSELSSRLQALETGKVKASSKGKELPKRNEGHETFEWEYRKRGTYSFVRCSRKPAQHFLDALKSTHGGIYSASMKCWKFNYPLDVAHVQAIFKTKPVSSKAVDYIRSEKIYDLAWSLEVE